MIPFTSTTFRFPDQVAPSAWIEHVPFMFWLFDALRPNRFVELGTHTGVSYCAACQAIELLSLPCTGCAIDTWKGDEHAGFYDEAVYSDLAAYHAPRYADFSRLMRSTFDDAVDDFEDGSIDLLHIDGLHSYDAVRRDFESWQPKLTQNAIVLFHDTNVHERDFGVFRLWSEVSAGRPHFEFLHGHGLGVLGIGKKYPKAIAALFAAGKQDSEREAVRSAFAHLGQAVAQRGTAVQAARQAEAEFALSRKEWQRQIEQRDAEFALSRENWVRQLESRDNEIARAQEATSAIEERLRRSEFAVRELRDSTSWRVTGPLRALSAYINWLLRSVRS
ncbi:class I SAM-dependent methyltransferase [Mesorhizobium sp. RSR380A]|uniref:class I SAM-dependent methyltransferase n=1 Tax=unclassified Mesorhizobium TaxID=325217 RepID=UPI0003CE393A|nr:class I SAM-dependent methyltransferase [Mesorhizobium sp. LNJC380A00]ESY43307.1 hypothetical protein X746_22715 [Mesorhizobium sp. LNJC380A00]